MAGIPKRRPGERRNSYRLRCVDAECTRRKTKEMDQFFHFMRTIEKIHADIDDFLMEEWSRYCRAKPGSYYDRTAKKRTKK